jgi:hypothetical protein
MMNGLPPSRYKIIERDRRLITIDTQTGLEAGTKPRLNAPPSALARQPVDLRAGEPRGGAFNEIFTSLAALVTQGRVDEANRPLLKTSKLFDPQGPRVVVLSTEGFRRVGALVFGSAVLALLTLALSVFTGYFFSVLVIAVVAGRAVGKPVLTALMAPVLASAPPATVGNTSGRTGRSG